MKTQPTNHQKQPLNDQITESITIPFDPNSFTSLRHILNPDIPLRQKYDNPCHNSNIGVYPEVNNDRVGDSQNWVFIQSRWMTPPLIPSVILLS